MAKERMDKSLGPLGVSQALHNKFLLTTALFLYPALFASFPAFFDLSSFLDIHRGALGVFILFLLSHSFRQDASQISYHSCCWLDFLEYCCRLKRMEFAWRFQ